MKTAAKVFLILGLVGIGFTILYSLVIALVIGAGPEEIKQTFIESGLDLAIMPVVAGVFLVMMIMLMTPALIFQIMGLSKISKARCKADVPVWLGVCTIIFGNLIAGILMLCLTDKDFPDSAPTYAQSFTAQTVDPQSGTFYSTNGDSDGGTGFSNP